MTVGDDESTHADTLPTEPTLPELQQYAALHNDELRAAFHQWQAGVHEIAQARSLPDPKLSYSYYIVEVETRVGPQHQAISLSQMVPWFGTLALRGDKAAEEAIARWWELQRKRLGLQAEVQQAWVEYYYLHRARRITEENAALLSQVEQVLRTRYKTAGADQPDVLRIQTELGQLQDRIRTLQAMVEPALSRLNALLGRPPHAALGVPETLPAPPLQPDLAAWTEQLDAYNPTLRAMEHRVLAADRQVALARKAYFPDLTFGATWIDTGDRTGPSRPSDSGQDPVVAMFSLNLPIWYDRLSAGMRQARHARRAVEAIRRQTRRDLRAELSRAAFRMDDARRKLALYDRLLLPNARDALVAVRKDYTGGRGSFVDLLDAQRVLLEFQLTRARALADLVSAEADIHRLVGVRGDAQDVAPVDGGNDVPPPAVWSGDATTQPAE